jgi:hypothetical protein
MLWQGALPSKFANFKMQNEECHYYGLHSFGVKISHGRPWTHLTHHGLDSRDSPRPGLGGRHHYPPYSILCITPPHPHPNNLLSRDSQCGVPKLSRFGLLGLWAIIASRPNLRSRRGLNQSCSSPREISNAISHSPSACQDWVDFWLLVIRSQTVQPFFCP